MEKKKLLLVAISVGIFLVIAIGAAIVFMPKKGIIPSGAIASRPASGGSTGITVPSPSNPPLPVAAGPGPASGTGSASGTSPAAGPGPTSGTDFQPSPVDPVGLVKGPGDVPGLKSPPEGTTRQGADFYVNGTLRVNPVKSPETIINVPKPSSAAIPDAPAAGSTKPNKVVSAPAPRPASPAPKPAAQSKPPAPTKVHDDFWVQAGAFSTIAKAEGVKESLASRGITSIIENRDMDGKTLFRVRTGPYTSKNEADYWLSLIKTIQKQVFGFEDSQVRLTQTKR